MIACPNCAHQNPDGATQCEQCYTPLPATTACPHCGAPVQTDATFCGQCGSNIKPPDQPEEAATPEFPDIPDLEPSQPFPQPVEMGAASTPGATVVSSPPEAIEINPVSPPPPPTTFPEPASTSWPATPDISLPEPEPVVSQPSPSPSPVASSSPSKTRLQQQTARFLHVQTNQTIELPQNLAVIHIGKPNDHIPPDIDVSGFPNSEVVSRIHADVRVEADAYFLEDVGSANGTYVNHNPLPPGNRHRLRPGDRIGLGKGDLVTFLFQIS